MRKESDDVGPKAELEHWKKRLARFDSLTTCVKNAQCRTVVSILIAAKSKVLKVSSLKPQSWCFQLVLNPYFFICLSTQTWKDLDVQITDFTNESKDNVKFLYTLEKFCEPLYKCNPVSSELLTSHILTLSI